MTLSNTMKVSILHLQEEINPNSPRRRLTNSYQWTAKARFSSRMEMSCKDWECLTTTRLSTSQQMKSEQTYDSTTEESSRRWVENQSIKTHYKHNFSMKKVLLIICWTRGLVMTTQLLHRKHYVEKSKSPLKI